MKRPLLAVLASLVTACSLIVGLKDRELGDADSGADAYVPPSDGKVDAPPSDTGVDAGVDASCGPDASFLSDKLNCGSCGHDCGGGDCMAGKCQAILLNLVATGGDVVDLSVDSTNIYWTTSGTVQMCPLSGCNGLPTVLNMGGSGYIDIAVYKDRVFWSTPTIPYVVLADGGGVTAIDTATATSQMLVDNGHLYWTETVNNGVIRWCSDPLTCTANTSANYSSAPTAYGTNSLAISSGTLFFGENAAGKMFSCQLGMCGAPTDMQINSKAITAVVANSKQVYFSSGSPADTLYACNVAGCAGSPNLVITGESSIGTLGLDAHLFWIKLGTAVRHCDPTMLPCIAQTLVSGNAHGLAIDSKFIYFGDGPKVMKIVKP
jgi:hypothetical protein